jgi:hypothetical protein
MYYFGNVLRRLAAARVPSLRHLLSALIRSDPRPRSSGERRMTDFSSFQQAEQLLEDEITNRQK